jgi:hypothetical protein
MWFARQPQQFDPQGLYRVVGIADQDEESIVIREVKFGHPRAEPFKEELRRCDGRYQGLRLLAVDFFRVHGVPTFWKLAGTCWSVPLSQCA